MSEQEEANKRDRVGGRFMHGSAYASWRVLLFERAPAG